MQRPSPSSAMAVEGDVAELLSSSDRDEAIRLLAWLPRIFSQESSLELASSPRVSANPSRGITGDRRLGEEDETMEMTGRALPKKDLPERGRLLQAVIEAGPLLETLLVAGSLPKWRNPPPLLPFQPPPNPNAEIAAHRYHQQQHHHHHHQQQQHHHDHRSASFSSLPIAKRRKF
ncbi:uncharacterized protein LOC144701441 [Wolffia australiana]